MRRAKAKPGKTKQTKSIINMFCTKVNVTLLTLLPYQVYEPKYRSHDLLCFLRAILLILLQLIVSCKCEQIMPKIIPITGKAFIQYQNNRRIHDNTMVLA